MISLPTRNSELALRRADFRSVPEMLDYAARGDTGITFYNVRGEILSALPWRDVRARAQVMARRLIGAGFAPGERILVTADTWPGFFDTFFGAQYAGLLPVPVSIPVGIGGKDAYLDQLRRQLAASGAVAAVGVDDLAGFLAEAAKEFPAVRLHGGLAALQALPEKQVDLRPLGPDDLCYIQFSSGSTRHPHGVQIAQRALMANLAGMTGPAGLDVVAGDRAVSWLPLYHDMGLIGFLMAPLSSQLSIDYLTPRDFARRPTQWLNLISRNRGTIAYSPSFGYDLVARRAKAGLPADIDLSCLQIAGIGADMIQAAALERFATAVAAAGFDRRAFLASYGMAELCVGLSFGRRFGGVRFDGDGGRPFAVCGAVLPHHRVQIRDRDGVVHGERRIGRLYVQGPSVMPGYYGRPEASAAVLAGGWLDTGDLGDWHGEELVITGRAKDLMIVNGRNIWPQDIEWAVEGLSRLRRGDACAFALEAGEREEIVLLVQCFAEEAGERAELMGGIRQVVKEAVGIDCRIVLISRRHRLPLTSSGKLSRTRARENFVAGLYADALDAAA